MTAVEFLIEEVECRGITTKELRLAFEQAKEMEKEYQDDLAIEFTYYLSDWHTKKRIKQLLKMYKETL